MTCATLSCSIQCPLPSALFCPYPYAVIRVVNSMKRFTFASVAILSVIALVFASRYYIASRYYNRSLEQVIAPQDETLTAIAETINRVHLFTRVNGTLPNSLRDLPERAGYLNRTRDYWGTDLAYRIHEDGLVTISSVGLDGTTGGSGEGLDLKGTYNSAEREAELFAGNDLCVAWNLTEE